MIKKYNVLTIDAPSDNGDESIELRVKRYSDGCKVEISIGFDNDDYNESHGIILSPSEINELVAFLSK